MTVQKCFIPTGTAVICRGIRPPTAFLNKFCGVYNFIFPRINYYFHSMKIYFLYASVNVCPYCSQLLSHKLFEWQKRGE